MGDWSTDVWHGLSDSDVAGMFLAPSSLSATAAVDSSQQRCTSFDGCTTSVAQRPCAGWIVDGNVMLLGLARGRFADPQSRHCGRGVSHGGPLSGRFRECFEPSRITTLEDVDNDDDGEVPLTADGGPSAFDRCSSPDGDGYSRSGLKWLKFSCEKAVTGETIAGATAGLNWSKSRRAPAPMSIRCFLTEVSSAVAGLSTSIGQLRSSFSNSSSWPRKLKFGEIVGLLSLTYLKRTAITYFFQLSQQRGIKCLKCAIITRWTMQKNYSAWIRLLP